VERSSTSGDVEGWPGRPQREMFEIYACCIRLSNTASTSRQEPLAACCDSTTYSRRSTNGPCFFVISTPKTVKDADS
jgi:hypothetical protein